MKFKNVQVIPKILFFSCQAVVNGVADSLVTQMAVAIREVIKSILNIVATTSADNVFRWPPSLQLFISSHIYSLLSMCKKTHKLCPVAQQASSY